MRRLALYLGDYSRWFRAAVVEAPYLQEVDHTQPTFLWLFYALAQLIVINGILRLAWVQETEVALCYPRLAT